MAKTIMVSDALYNELKTRKGSRSFTETITDALDRENDKTGSRLWKHYGAIEDDNEWPEIKRELRRGWKAWSTRYA